MVLDDAPSVRCDKMLEIKVLKLELTASVRCLELLMGLKCCSMRPSRYSTLGLSTKMPSSASWSDPKRSTDPNKPGRRGRGLTFQ